MYDILFENKCVGRAEMSREGLFYCIRCTCIPPERGTYTITLTDGERNRNLGICVPEGDHFTLFTRLACKHMTADKPVFRLVNGQVYQRIPFTEGMEWDDLDKLELSKLEYTDGIPEIVIEIG